MASVTAADVSLNLAKLGFAASAESRFEGSIQCEQRVAVHFVQILRLINQAWRQ